MGFPVQHVQVLREPDPLVLRADALQAVNLAVCCKINKKDPEFVLIFFAKTVANANRVLL